MVKLLPALVPALIGVVVIVLADGDAVMTAIGAGLIGVAAVIAVAGVFYAVGRSEDRERAGGPPPDAG